MSDGTVERDPREVSTKARLLEEITSLADPSTAKRSDIVTFLSRSQFKDTYHQVLQKVGPIIVGDFFSDYHLQAIYEGKDVEYSSFLNEGKNLVGYLSVGRDALEDASDIAHKTGGQIDMWTYWQGRGMMSDETLLGVLDYEAMKRRKRPSELISRQGKMWALYGAFAWALARGWPDQAIDCLELVARIKNVPQSSVINHFEPVVSSMRTQVEKLGQDVRGPKGPDVIGGYSVRDYLQKMDGAMEKQGFIFNNQSNKYISLSPTD